MGKINYPNKTKSLNRCFGEQDVVQNMTTQLRAGIDQSKPRSILYLLLLSELGISDGNSLIK